MRCRSSNGRGLRCIVIKLQLLTFKMMNIDSYSLTIQFEHFKIESTALKRQKSFYIIDQNSQYLSTTIACSPTASSFFSYVRYRPTGLWRA
jgi:hypothetical protein